MSPIEAHLLFSVFCWSKSNQNVANKRYDSKIKCDYETILASLTVTLTIPMSSQSLFALFQLNFQILATYCWICPFVFSMMYADDIHWYDTELNIYSVHLNIYFSVAIFLFLNSFFFIVTVTATSTDTATAAVVRYQSVLFDLFRMFSGRLNRFSLRIHDTNRKHNENEIQLVSEYVYKPLFLSSQWSTNGVRDFLQSIRFLHFSHFKVCKKWKKTRTDNFRSVFYFYCILQILGTWKCLSTYCYFICWAVLFPLLHVFWFYQRFFYQARYVSNIWTDPVMRKT